MIEQPTKVGCHRYTLRFITRTGDRPATSPTGVFRNGFAVCISRNFRMAEQSDAMLCWILKLEQCEAQPVQTARRRVPYSVVEHEPSSGCFDRRRRQTNLVGIPPSAAARFQYEPVPAPMTQVWRIGDPHVRAEWRHRSMNERPIPVDSSRQKGGVLIIR